MWVERLLPWYDAVIETRRQARTERIKVLGEAARSRAERVIAAYEDASRVQAKAGRALVNEARRQ